MENSTEVQNSGFIGVLSVPEQVRVYLAYRSQQVPLRAFARQNGLVASTVLRQMRRLEERRSDPLVDAALQGFERTGTTPTICCHGLQEPPIMLSEMTKSIDNTDARIIREARRILRRLCESGAYLLVAPGLERAAVFRDGPGGNPNRIAVAERDVIHAFALKDWISGRRLGQLGRYEITAAGRAALKRILAEDEAARRRNAGEIEIETVFQSQHHEEGERWIMPEEGGSVRKLRFNMAESPWTALGRKRTQDGVPYLAAELVAAGERLREDFELAQMGPKVTQNWDRFLTACIHRGSNRAEAGEKAESARRRIGDAMAVMGPGLADVAFRCCCFLEGLETAEKRMGWAARSGKVVLKIALRRLADHYGDCDRGRLRRAG